MSKRKKIMDMEMDSPYKKAIAIFFNNAIASGCSFGISVDNGHERSVYLLLSLLNHSYVPNSAYTELVKAGKRLDKNSLNYHRPSMTHSVVLLEESLIANTRN